jgi:hypothetical protein
MAHDPLANNFATSTRARGNFPTPKKASASVACGGTPLIERRRMVAALMRQARDLVEMV